jgi:hypothetical protein
MILSSEEGGEGPVMAGDKYDMIHDTQKQHIWI